MEIMFVIVPVFIGFVFLIILFQMGKNVSEWMDNNRKPIETAPAKVVAKRSATSGNVSSNQGGMVTTYYYATFEFKSGERREFWLNASDYGLLAEGDHGQLTHQGTRFHRFERPKAN
jgi:Protein of unknown function (DUF2500)